MLGFLKIMSYYLPIGGIALETVAMWILMRVARLPIWFFVVYFLFMMHAMARIIGGLELMEAIDLNRNPLSSLTIAKFLISVGLARSLKGLMDINNFYVVLFTQYIATPVILLLSALRLGRDSALRLGAANA